MQPPLGGFFFGYFMSNTIAVFPISTEEDLRFQLKFDGLNLTGRTLEVAVRERSSNTVKATLTIGAGLTLAGTNDLTALYPKASMAGWARSEYQADLVDKTSGQALRLMAVRIIYDEPGNLVYGVNGNQATVRWGGNQAVVTAIGGVGPAGPANSLAIGTVDTLPAGSTATASVTGTAPNQTLNLGLPQGNTGDQGDAGTITIDTVTTGAPGSSVVITNTGTAENAVLDITIPRGDVGAKGDKGWAPILAVVTDGVRRVLQVSDWTGGEGTKPTAGLYVGAAGLVSDIASAVDIRGPQGPSGSVTDGDKGDVVVSASGTVWTIDNDAVSFAKMQNVATARILGRTTASSGDIEELTGTQATALLSPVVGDSGSGGAKGLVPAPTAGDAAAGKFFAADGTWKVPEGIQPGMRGEFFRNTAPSGWLKANGAAVDKSAYAALDAAIYCGDANNAAAAWGYRCTNPASPSATRSTTGGYIVLPDARGEFSRGWDDGRGVDTGRSLWSAQAQAIESHGHSITDPGHSHTSRVSTGGTGGASPPAAGDGTASGFVSGANGTSTTGITINTTGGTETRPRNIAALVCIKY